MLEKLKMAYVRLGSDGGVFLAWSNPKYPKYTYNINMLSEKMCEEIDLFRRDCKR